MNKFIYPVLFLFFSALLIFAWSEKPRHELENNIVRLHIIANSNTAKDQEIKLKVRDEITESAKASGRVLSMPEMKNIADNILKSNGFNYTSTVTFGKTKITRRKYGSFSLPEGIYKAVRIKLGDAQGENWWCVLSPPLCFTDSVFGDTEELSEYLSSETNKIINGDKINIRFRILEIASQISCKLGI